MSLYYAVNRSGAGYVFTTAPVRNEHFGIWEGRMEGCFSELVRTFEADGMPLPNITFMDEPVKLTLTLCF